MFPQLVRSAVSHLLVAPRPPVLMNLAVLARLDDADVFRVSFPPAARGLI